MRNEEFRLSSLMNNQSTSPSAALKLVVSNIPIENIVRNPENSIYLIGDISRLKADIAERGIRQPLEVLSADARGNYMLIGGERRWTACFELYNQGDERFEKLPCIVKPSGGVLDDRIALITANATARELTDGERLDQYAALKAALEEKKAAGELEGRVRSAIMDVTGDGSGTVGRLNAIVSNCIPEVQQMVRDGECTLTRAYQASQREGAQAQLYFAQHGEDLRVKREPSAFEVEQREKEQYQKGLQKMQRESTQRFLLGCLTWELVARVDEVRAEYRKRTLTDGTAVYVCIDLDAPTLEDGATFRVMSHKKFYLGWWCPMDDGAFLDLVREKMRGENT